MRVSRVIRALILFSTALGVPFLVQVYPLLPSTAFYFVALGWLLFVIDSALTFFRLKASFYLAFVLALLALGESLGQSAHYSLLQSGNVEGSATLVAGASAQVLILILIPYFFIGERKKDPWAWPGAKFQA